MNIIPTSQPIQQIVARAAAEYEAQHHRAPNCAKINARDFGRRKPEDDQFLPNLILAADPDIPAGIAYVYFDQKWHQQKVDSGLADET